jgi:nickel-dependent lactate racemase
LFNEHAVILDALQNPINSLPLREQVKPGDTVVIVHTAITRATPNLLILPIIPTQTLKSLTR